MAKRFLVLAYVLKNGAHKIEIRRVECPADRWVGMARKFSEMRNHADWQASSYDTKAAAVSGIIADYGLGWFNRARGQLSQFAA